MLNFTKSVNIAVSNREVKCKMSTGEMRKKSGLLITEKTSQSIANVFQADRVINDSAHKLRQIKNKS